MTNKRTFLMGLGALALSSFAVPAAAQQLSLNAISGYMNGLQTAQGGFTQINGDGTLSTGQIYIKRPGRIRFEYNAPDNSLVLAGGGQVAIFDPRSNTGPDRYPLNQTANPIELRQWIVTDDVGSQTTVILNDLVSGGRINENKFSIVAETKLREN